MNAKKGFDRSVDSPVELQLAFCLQQNLDKGGGVGKKLLYGKHFFAGFQPGLIARCSKGRLTLAQKLQVAL